MARKSNGARVTPPKLVDRAEPICIANGRVIDPVNRIDDQLTVTIAQGKIISVSKEIPSEFRNARTIDACGKWIVPGLMDMHVHLREPGREDKETIETGTQAAAAGGFTSVACMPNTNPVLDEESKIRYVIQRSEGCACRVFPIGAITKGSAGDELAPMGEMVKAGARAFSDDGRPVEKSNIMRNAFNYSKSFNVPVICHCEDSVLSQKGHMNEGVVSTKLGVRGIPSIAEEIGVGRDLLLAEYTGARVHIAHISTAGSVRLVREAKKRGVLVTAETCSHYFSLIDADIGMYDTNKKMNPPLRTEVDRLAIIEGLADGTIDVIASDHAPHVSEEKDVEFDAAAFGVIGLETSLGVVMTHLVEKKLLTPFQMVEKMSVNPNRIFSLPGGNLSVGSAADIVIIDPELSWVVDPKDFFSKARNSAFIDSKLTGRALCTILNGHVVYDQAG